MRIGWILIRQNGQNEEDMMDNVRVGVIGCGGRGRGHIRSLKAFEDVHLSAVCGSGCGDPRVRV